MTAGSMLTVSAPGVLGNDTDIDSVIAAGGADGGSRSRGAGAGRRRFVHLFACLWVLWGPDSFSYMAADGQSTSGVAVVTLTVNPPPDTTAPNVTMTSPAAGATVSGTLTVSANASDNVAVSAVQFLLDGAPLGAEDTTAPFSVSWNSTSTPNGVHQLSARARDAATNQTTASAVSVTVNKRRRSSGRPGGGLQLQ